MWVLDPTPQTGVSEMAEISPLRRRMIEDMTVRNMSPATQRSYISAVSKFSRYFGRSPDRLTLNDVHAFQVHLVSTGISWPGLNRMQCQKRSEPQSEFDKGYIGYPLHARQLRRYEYAMETQCNAISG